MGEAYRGLKKNQKAIEYYEKALEIDPNFEKAKNNLKLLEPKR